MRGNERRRGYPLVRFLERKRTGCDALDVSFVTEHVRGSETSVCNDDGGERVHVPFSIKQYILFIGSTVGQRARPASRYTAHNAGLFVRALSLLRSSAVRKLHTTYIIQL